MYSTLVPRHVGSRAQERPQHRDEQSIDPAYSTVTRVKRTNPVHSTVVMAQITDPGNGSVMTDRRTDLVQRSVHKQNRQNLVWKQGTEPLYSTVRKIRGSSGKRRSHLVILSQCSHVGRN